jgi:hypothetical protein
VLPQKTAPTFSFRLMPNSCSRRSESSYFTVDALNFILIMSLYLTSFFASIIFPSIACSTACVREPTFQPDTCMINVWTFNLYDRLALWGVTYDRNSAWWNKNLDSCTNSTMKIFWATVIVSPTSLEFKMLQEGLAWMQNDVYGAYTLKAGSNLFTWDKW